MVLGNPETWSKTFKQVKWPLGAVLISHTHRHKGNSQVCINYNNITIDFSYKVWYNTTEGEMNMSKIGNLVIELLEQGYTMEDITNSQVELVTT